MRRPSMRDRDRPMRVPPARAPRRPMRLSVPASPSPDATSRPLLLPASAVMATEEDTVRLLERVPLFDGLTPAEVEELAKVAVPRTYEAGQVVFREGDQGDTCFVVKSGAIKISREHGGRTIALAELRVGDMFGELSMFGGEVRSATAAALEDTAAIALLAGDVRRLLAGN